jgi:hypothetical protein
MLLKNIVETGAGVSFYRSVLQFELDLFVMAVAPPGAQQQPLKFSASDFLKSHFMNAIALSKTLLETAGPEHQEPAWNLLVALLQYGSIKQDSLEKVLVVIGDIAETKQIEFPPEVIQLIQQQCIDILAGSDVNSCTLSSLSCICSILKFCKCSLDGITPTVLLECFQKASQTRPPEFEVCIQILNIAALHAQTSDHPQISEVLSLGIDFLTSDSCDSAFIEALSFLATAQRSAPAVIEKAVLQLTTIAPRLSDDAYGKGSKKLKTSVSASIECSLPGFLSFLYGHVNPAHPLKAAVEGVVKRCMETPGTALTFGMQCLHITPQQTHQLAARFSDQATVDTVLNAFAKMSDLVDEKITAIHDATAALLLTNAEFASRLFEIVDADVSTLIKVSADDTANATAAAVVFPKFLFFRKALGQWIDRSIVKVVDGDIQWIEGLTNCNAVIHRILEMCFRIPLSHDGALAAISTVCVGILSTGLFLDFRGPDGQSSVVNFAQKNRLKTQAIILDVVLASTMISSSGSNLNRDGMFQALNPSIVSMLQSFSLEILSPTSSVPELTGSDVNSKMFKSALLACTAAVDAMGSTMPLSLYQEIATGCSLFLRRFSNADDPKKPTSVQIWKVWEAYGGPNGALTWSLLLTKAAIRKDDSEGGYSLRDFTHSLRSIALDLASKLASANLFPQLDAQLQEHIVQRIISHLDDFRPEGSSVAVVCSCNLFCCPFPHVVFTQCLTKPTKSSVIFSSFQHFEPC